MVYKTNVDENVGGNPTGSTLRLTTKRKCVFQTTLPFPTINRKGKVTRMILGKNKLIQK